ncbi:MAG: DUF6491 family protein [Rhizomicrobium sp.]
MRKLALVAAVAVVAATTPAFAKPTICIRQDDIYNWSSPDDKHLVLENLRHQKALLTLIGTCGGFKFTETLMIRSPGAMGVSCVSRGDMVTTHDLGFRGTCSVVKIEPYTGPVGTHHGGQSGDTQNSSGH